MAIPGLSGGVIIYQGTPSISPKRTCMGAGGETPQVAQAVSWLTTHL